MLRGLLKRPMNSTNQNSEVGSPVDEGSGFGLKMNTKSEPPMSDMDEQVQFNEEDSVSREERNVTPEIKEELLQGFDMKRHKIASLIQTQDQSIDLAQESKPVRDVLKASFGVTYKEDVEYGGVTNVRIVGESFYSTPGRQMRKSELEYRQEAERASKVHDYAKSRLGELEGQPIDAIIEIGSGSNSKAASQAGRFKQVKIASRESKVETILNGSQSHTGDSLFQPSVRSNAVPSPRIDLPSLSRDGMARLVNSQGSQYYGKSRSHVRPKRDKMKGDKLDQLLQSPGEFVITNDGMDAVKDESRPTWSPTSGASHTKGLNSQRGPRPRLEYTSRDFGKFVSVQVHTNSQLQSRPSSHA